MLVEELTLTVTVDKGVHFRTCGRITDICKKFNADITFEVNGKSAKSESILNVMLLAIKQYDEILCRVEAANEVELKGGCEALRDLLAQGSTV